MNAERLVAQIRAGTISFLTLDYLRHLAATVEDRGLELADLCDVAEDAEKSDVRVGLYFARELADQLADVASELEAIANAAEDA